MMARSSNSAWRLPASIALAAVVVLSSAAFGLRHIAAACTPLPTTLGTDTLNFNVSTSGPYRIWMRLKTADSTKNSVLLQVDNTVCNLTAGGSSLPANTWTWVSYSGGVASSTIITNLAAGAHTIVLAGNAPGVEVDRVVMTQDTACIPSGTGDNCATPPDKTPPVVSITAPADNANVSGSFTVTAAATDDTGVSKVEFYVDNVLKATDATYPYTYVVPAGLTNGTHTVTARAYDTVNNNATSNAVSVHVSSASNAAPKIGDINGDGVVNILDFSLLASNFNKSANAASNRHADINGDGVVNLLDFSLLAAKFGK